ncbi:uncharacterized protein LOC126687831 [Mercurialis annua]|uniref:uncharacterized protein LOC126687831 n=1 Tax=Mercurialis annua TaxID=3986 RepID=UPI0024ACA66D|nr:uncharacterized protein LOC126687831 [Mercurialis annua]
MHPKQGTQPLAWEVFNRNCLQSLYGDAFPPSPTKGRSPVNRDRKLRDLRSPLGPHGEPQSMVRPPVEVASVEEEEVDRQRVAQVFKLEAQLLPWRFHEYRGSSHISFKCFSMNNGVLPDTRSLRNRLVQKLDMVGLSMSVDCLDLLNNAMDIYLKRSNELRIALASSKCVHNHLRNTKSVCFCWP